MKKIISYRVELICTIIEVELQCDGSEEEEEEINGRYEKCLTSHIICSSSSAALIK